MTRHAVLILLGLVILVIEARACAKPAASDVRGQAYVPIAEQGAPRCNRWRGDDWWPCIEATLTAAARTSSTPTRASATWPPSYPQPRWNRIAIVHADQPKPTAASTPTRTPTATRPPRSTRTPRTTGTPTQSGMLPPPTCGAGTVEPGLWTPWPACYPHGPSFTPTPTATGTPTPTGTALPATATWEPTPTPALQVLPAPGGVAPVPTAHVYRFPLVLVWRRRPDSLEIWRSLDEYN